MLYRLTFYKCYRHIQAIVNNKKKLFLGVVSVGQIKIFGCKCTLLSRVKKAIQEQSNLKCKLMKYKVIVLLIIYLCVCVCIVGVYIGVDENKIMPKQQQK